MIRTAVICNAIRVERSIVACALIARFLRDRFGWEVVDSMDARLSYRARYETVIMVNSPWGFCDEAHRERVRSLAFSARRLIWIQNDYNTGIGPRSFKGMGAYLDGGGVLELWTTIADYVERGYVTRGIPLGPRSTYVNWNALHYQPRPRVRRAGFVDEPSVFYFGAYRPERVAKFVDYLVPRRYEVTISTTGRGPGKFENLLRPRMPRGGAALTFEDRATDLIERLAHAYATVYIEDRRATEIYVSPAARFYEALAAGTPQFIDRAAVPTLTRAGFRVDPAWVVDSGAELAEKLRDAPAIGAAQARAWRRRPIRAEFETQLRKAIS